MTQVPVPPPSDPTTPVDYGTPGKSDMSWAAITSLICGIVSFVPGCCCGCVAFPAAIAGIIFGILGWKSEKALFAKIGLGLSVAGIVIAVLLIILNLVFHFALPGSRGFSYST